jgi:aldehyde dehydrogenase (NAD+)
MSVALRPAPPPHTEVDALTGLADRLRETFRSGRTRSLDWRSQQLEGLCRLVRENSEELVGALQADLGRPTFEAWTADLASVVQEAELARKQLKRWTAPEKISTPLSQRPARARIVREPLGVVLVIAPWNYPLQLLLSPLSGALAAGNCAVCKPSEVTANTSAALARLLPRYLDPDAVAVVEGGVPETGALLEQRFDHIFYTGNGHVGRIVLEAAAKHLTPVTLELGGKSPCIVDGSADLPVAAHRIAWGKFLNAGQTCIAPDYILVSEEREAPLLEALGKAIGEFYGDDPHRSADFGRIASERHHRRLAALLGEGEVVVGGQSDEQERYIAPTVLRGVSPDSPLMAEEIFGPILPVLRMRDLDEALAFVNQREKPLALYLFSASAEVERRVVEGTSSGGVCVNGTLWHIANPKLPFGGVGPSGMGAYHGRHTFETFSHRKAVVTKPTWLDPKVMYPPYGRLKTKLVKRLL